MIDFTSVSVTVRTPGRPDKALLADITVSLSEARVAVVGANGSGKSTLLRLINGLILPSSGQVAVDGHDVAREGRLVRSQVGFIFTDPLAQLVMSTPVDDVELSLRRLVRDGSERRRRARQLLADRGLDHVAEQSIYDLSGGERQLVALTSVLAVEPRILVADEPTTLLDLRNRNRLVAELATLPQQVVFATHDLDFAATADRVIVITDGRISHDGSPDIALAQYREAMA